jgi:hypothetical protein
MAHQFYETEKCFRRYENYIHQALIAYPEEIRFEPEVRTAATDAARCRDAITAWRHKKWASNLDAVAYKEQLRNLTAWQYMGYVCVGPRELMKIARSEPDPDVKRLKSKLAMEKLKLPPKLSKSPEQLEEIAKDAQQDFNALPIQEAVEMIDTGLHAGPYICENTLNNLSSVVKAVEGRMNVVYVINKEGKIQIF